ncbi:hypothetical protein PVK06_043918 [Gossypium arboreum]|uniref:Reverse transcriptase n=1 Tax=Gossypium arboreum TaxID=29729 RepID=A0ABR0MPQ0_GOSAR|nr:hypothetical protein PVK06_043918 [Gossypium arboreum]
MESVRLKYGFENGIDVGAVGSKGSLSLGWKGNSLIRLKSFSSFHIDVDVQDVECDTTWHLMGFYGNPEKKNRRESWELLRHLGQDQKIHWIVLGDFNEIVSSFEKKGGRLRADHQMHDFRMALEDCGLNDLGYIGRGKTRLQMFFDLKLVSVWIILWREKFKEVGEKQLEVSLVGLNLQADQEELFWEQRARVNWLKNRDRNISFFHKMAVQRQNHGRINELEGMNGTRAHITEEMLKLSSNFFEDLFSAFEIGADERVFGLVEKQITDYMNDSLLQQFTEEEIACAVKMMEPLKAPRSDGFPAIFFQRY